MSDANVNSGDKAVYVVLTIACPHCQEPIEWRMTEEAARRHAQGVLAAADGLERVKVEVRGSG